MDVSAWKELLKSERLYNGDTRSERQDDQFKFAVQKLEDRIAQIAPAVRGLIWSKGEVRAEAADVREALKLIEKSGVANFDALGDPTAPDYMGSPFKAMFISQDDAAQDEWNPKGNQNQGTWQSDVPKKSDAPKAEKAESKPAVKEKDVDSRMEKLVALIESVESKAEK